MHRKLKNLLSGLALATVALIGGAMFGEPAQPRALDMPLPALAIEPSSEPVRVDLSKLMIEVREGGVRLHIVTTPVATPTPETRPVPRRHAAFQMPYFSFGATLPRVPLPSES